MVLSAAVGRVIGRPIGRILGAGDIFDVNFTLGAMPAIFTFARASTATLFNSTPELTSAALNQPRFDHDPVTGAPRGLLVEGAATNLFTNNSLFNFAGNLAAFTSGETDPLGTSTAYLMDEGSAGSYKAAAVNNITFTNTSTFCVAAVVKKGECTTCQLLVSSGVSSTAFANFDIDAMTVGTKGSGAVTSGIIEINDGFAIVYMTLVGNGASGTAFVAMTTSTSATRLPTYTGTDRTMTLHMMQAEVGAFPTSMIITAGSAVTRAADITTITNLASIGYNPTEGTVFVEFEWVGLGTNQWLFQIDDGTTSNRIAIRYASGTFGGTIAVGGSTTNMSVGSAPAVGFVHKVALAYKAGEYALSLNGAAVLTNALASVPSGLTTVRIGSAINTAMANGWIRRVTYFPTRLPNAQLQALTA